jgi:hypothetical protein
VRAPRFAGKRARSRRLLRPVRSAQSRHRSSPGLRAVILIANLPAVSLANSDERAEEAPSADGSRRVRRLTSIPCPQRRGSNVLAVSCSPRSG